MNVRKTRFPDKLLTLRGSLSGESSQALHRWARDLSPTLSPAEHSALLVALRQASRQAEVTSSLPVLSRELRQRILPAARAETQHELEAGVLEALIRGMQHLRYHPHAWRLRLGDIVRAVRPAPDSLSLTLDPHVLGPMLAELLPIENPDSPLDISGTVGARMRWSTIGKLEIVLVDAPTRATVTVTGVGPREWRAAVAYLRAERSAAFELGERHPTVLAPDEGVRLDYGPRFYLPTYLASGILRRVRAFSDVWSMSVIGRGLDSIEVEWHGGPTLATVLAAFCHPVTQVARGRFSSRAWHEAEFAEIEDHDAPHRTAGRRVVKSGRLFLQRLRPAEPHPAASASGVMDDLWQEWESAYTPSVGKARISHQFDQLVELRRACTGEPRSSASKLLKALQQESSSQGVGWLVPEAHSVHQRVLETSLLLAIRDADIPVGDHVLPQYQVYRTVSPRSRRLVVEVEHLVARKLLRSLLSSQQPEPSGSGVPGLRLKQGRNGIALKLLERDGKLTDAEVEIKNITMADWDRIWTDIDNALAPEHRRVDPRLDRSPDLSPGEQENFDHHRRICGPVGLGSAMLRRIGLLAGAGAIDVWAGLGKTEIHIEIYDGPSVSSVFEALRHLHTGLSPDLVTFDENDSSFCRVSDRSMTADRFTGDPENVFSPPALIFRPVTWCSRRRG